LLSAPGTYYLFVVADRFGYQPEGPTAATVAHSAGKLSVALSGSQVSADTTAPAVSITSPSNSSSVSGTVTVGATASDNVGVVGVQFLVDGAAVGAEDAAAPYSYSWDTTKAGNGPHTLTARARDAAGNATTSAPVTVTVANSTPDTQ